MSEKDYNGWSNYETWLVNLWWGDYLSEYPGEHEKGWVRDFVESVIEESGEEPPRGGFAADVLGSFLSRVDWREIEDHLEGDGE